MAAAADRRCSTCGKTEAKLCLRCESAYFCDATCQRRAWKEHKKVCRPREQGVEGLCGTIQPRMSTIQNGTTQAYVIDGFASREQCEVLRQSMDAMMEGTTHRGGYYLLYPDTPQAKELVDEATRDLLQVARRQMRMAVERLFRLGRIWVAGSLFSRAVAPAPMDALDKDPRHDYSRVHVDHFNLHQYEWAALLYLSDSGSDFEGGAFEFVEPGAVNCEELNTQDELDEIMERNGSVLPPSAITPVLPAQGRLLLFSAGKENPHRVQRVTVGRRHLLSVWLTSDPRYGMQD